MKHNLVVPFKLWTITPIAASLMFIAATNASESPKQLPGVAVNADADQETGKGPVEGYLARRSATGTKTDTPLIEIPQSIAIVTADRIEAIGATRVTEALAYTAGVNTSPWGDLPQYDWLYIRGFDAYAPGFYLDGLQMRNSGNWGLWQVDNYSLERIEVMRGPASVLYGQNGPGGVVNLVSKMPTSYTQNEIQLQLGNDQHKQLAFDLSGPIDDKSEYLYRLTGLIKDAELSTESLKNDRQYVAPSFTWQPNDAGKLTVYGQYLNIDAGSAWHSYPVEGTLLSNPNGKIPVSTLIGEPDFNRYDQEQWMIGYQGEYQVNDQWQVQQHGRYSQSDLDYGVIWGKWAQKNDIDADAPENFRYLARTPLSSMEKVNSTNLDTRVIGKIETGTIKHTLLFGIDYQKTDINVSAKYGGQLADLDLFNPSYGATVVQPEPNIAGVTKLVQLGFYLQDQIKLTKRWIVNLAGRYDSAEVKTFTPDGIQASDQTDDAFTGKFGLVYLADNGLAPYFSYSESFAPTTTVDPSTQRPFSPEEGRQYEVGVRYQPEDHVASYSAAVFDITREDFTQWVWDDIPGFKQTGEVNVQGFEFEAIVKPIESLNLTASYSWLPKAEVTSSGNLDDIGKQDKAVSEHQLSLWADYQFDNGLTLGGGARYTGSNQGTGEKAPIDVEGYTLLDAMLNYEFGQWALALNARNLTDKLVIATCNDRNCSYGSRRKVTLTATYQW
ncbi:TonB-dependent siderophore receptor [Colwellia psychrerythraea]|uniref:TonB-dependent siderophore receptor n=1 Tax=Colwellia psychrerythraea TaxID=28229 RepID=A0A099L532_COLPS|nr:TonB-dependent siderophore receptor [Colwellia psychrerythraea]KGJ97530.1 TonB-dependent siderophore receptor [Colwellia psychrerythraea]